MTKTGLHVSKAKIQIRVLCFVVTVCDSCICCAAGVTVTGGYDLNTAVRLSAEQLAEASPTFQVYT